MQNPVFSKNSNFTQAVKETTPAGYPAMPGYTVGGSATSTSGAYQSSYIPEQTGTYNARFEDIAQGYYQPSATSIDTDRMTYDDVIFKTGFLFVVLLATSVASWYAVLNTSVGVGLVGIGALGAFVLGLVNSFKQNPSPVLITIYAVFEGLFIGGISAVFESAYPGIVLTAVLASFVTFAVCLALFKTRIVRVNARFTKILFVGIISYLVFAGVSFLLSITGILSGGLRGITVFGLPLGVIVGVLVVILAAMSLIADFDFITQGVESGIPSKFAWTAAFGLLVTLVWLYLEILRLLSYFYDND